MDDPITWVVQANMLCSVYQNNVARILTELNIPFVGVNVIPFSDDLNWLFDEPTHKKVIPYGSTSLMRRAVAKGWEGLFFDSETFKVDAWLRNRKDMLNSSSIITDVRVAKSIQLREGFYHVRPVEDLKIFAGMVLSNTELRDWLNKTQDQQQLDSTLFSNDTIISISPAQEIVAEWRWFIVNRKIIDGSLYRYDGILNKRHVVNTIVIDSMQVLANDWLPHKTCVMDVALTSNNELKVIEFNCFNGSGFYDHDVAKILEAVTKSL